MNLVLEYPVTDEILTSFALAIGTDPLGYRNHIWRVLNFYCAINGILIRSPLRPLPMFRW